MHPHKSRATLPPSVQLGGGRLAPARGSTGPDRSPSTTALTPLSRVTGRGGWGSSNSPLPCTRGEGLGTTLTPSRLYSGRGVGVRGQSMAGSGPWFCHDWGSGAPYGVRLLEMLVHAGRRVPSHAQFRRRRGGVTAGIGSPGSVSITLSWRFAGRPRQRHPGRAGVVSPLSPISEPASPAGSFLRRAWWSARCSMGTVGRHRAWFVPQKPDPPGGATFTSRKSAASCWCRARTPLAPRAVTEPGRLRGGGAVACRPMPAFYTRPESLQDAVDFIVGRICRSAGERSTSCCGGGGFTTETYPAPPDWTDLFPPAIHRDLKTTMALAADRAMSSRDCKSTARGMEP